MKRTSFPYIPQMIAPATAARTIHIKKIPGATPRRCSSGPIPEGSVIWQIFCYPLRASIGSGIAAVFKGCCMPTRSTKSREVGILRGQDRSRRRAGQKRQSPKRIESRPSMVNASRRHGQSQPVAGTTSKTAALLYRAARRYRPPGAVAVLSLISGPAAGWGGAGPCFCESRSRIPVCSTTRVKSATVSLMIDGAGSLDCRIFGRPVRSE